ncbi:MAG: hypothetical protein UIB61_09675 [Treponema sp.]|nr:hypothetical protein [Treponema sp.]
MSSEVEVPWYTEKGHFQDVVISSRIRLARNLANFPFAMNFRGDDSERVQSLVFDAFSRIQSEEENFSFSVVDSKSINDDGRKLFEEWGVLKSSGFSKNPRRKFPEETGLVFQKKKSLSLSALVNSGDHVRISSFCAGLDFQSCFSECAEIDGKLQKNLQFAATYDFGYLTCALKDAGTGMKISARIHIPGIVRTGKFSLVTEFLKDKNLNISPAFPQISNGSAAGSFYLLSTKSSMRGSEFDQIAEFESDCMYIAEIERKILADYADTKRTVVFNSVIRSYSLAKFSLLESLSESVEIISDLMIGLKCGLISGIELEKLCELLFKIQPYHIIFLLKEGNFSFEKDILNDKKGKIDRLRALVLHEAVQNISLGNL